MKFYIITDYFFPSMGGLENSTAYLSASLQQKISAVEVFTITANQGEELNTSYQIRRFNGLGNESYKEMAKYIGQEGEEFAVCFMGFSEQWTEELLEFIQYLKNQFDCKISFKIPSVDSFSNFIHNEERLKKFMRVDYIICLNAKIKRDLVGKGIPQEKLVSRTNGVPAHYFVPAATENHKKAIRKKLGIDGKLTFVFTGRFSFVKRVDLLVEAFSKVESVNLVLVGDFDSRFAKGYSFTIPPSSTHIHWFKPTTNILPFLQAADVYVSASRSEGMSNSLLEAMSCGLPALVSDIEGHQQPINAGENGFFFKSENTDSLLEGIKWFIKHQAQHNWLSENARNTILEDYSIDRVADVYVRLLSKLKNRNMSVQIPEF